MLSSCGKAARPHRLIESCVLGITVLLLIGSIVLWVRRFFVMDELRWGISSRKVMSTGTQARWNMMDCFFDTTGGGGGGLAVEVKVMKLLLDADGRADRSFAEAGQGMHFESGLPEPLNVPRINDGLQEFRDYGATSWTGFALMYRKEVGPFGPRWVAGVAVPDWSLITFGLGASVWLIHRKVRRRSQTHGLCANCGYDLRASKDRCPECGAIIKVAIGKR